MKEELIKKLKALQAELDAVKDNGAAWKAARKLGAAAEILALEWPKESKAEAPKK